MKSKIAEPYIERAVIEIYGGCNYSCKMCPQSNPGRHHGFKKIMPLKDFENYLKQCVDKGSKIINLEGSGEATMVRELPEYIRLCKDYGTEPYVFSNGYGFRGEFMRECIDAGLSRFRFSVIGYNREEYKKWMSIDTFEVVKNNAIDAQNYIKKIGSNTKITSYHLITDNEQIEYQLEQYIKNWIEPTNCLSEIWKMHNWSGVYDNKNKRSGNIKTCGRPFAPEIIIRAGGLDGKTGAVHPCCQVLGRDEEAVLGHLSEQSFDDIWNGELYQKLREEHITGNYPDYCKDCDFLIDDPEVLVWTNHDRKLYKIAGTNFELDDYIK
jgi:MoaA/NifB/PqqE/SkfB family radical SAM enzyme